MGTGESMTKESYEKVNSIDLHMKLSVMWHKKQETTWDRKEMKIAGFEVKGAEEKKVDLPCMSFLCSLSKLVLHGQAFAQRSNTPTKSYSVKFKNHPDRTLPCSEAILYKIRKIYQEVSQLTNRTTGR